MTQLLTATDLVVGYQSPILQPLSFTLQTGDIVGLWGPNGVGKSTLLKAIAGTAQVFSGTLEKSEAATIAYQTQHPVKLDEIPITAREFLHYMEADSYEVPQQLNPILDHRLDRLSGGQFQLISVWTAVGSRANIVLLDEPTNNLDPKGIEALKELLLFQQDNRGIILVTHERLFLDSVCNKIIEIHQ